MPWMMGAAEAATVTSFTGGYTANGTTYAKNGDRLTLSVKFNGNSVRCALFEDVTSANNPILLGSTYDSGKATSYAFTFAAGSGDGPRAVRATAYTQVANGLTGTGTSASNQCRNVDPEAVNAAYVLDNTGPKVSGTVAAAPGTAPGMNGWFRGDVVVTWSCSDTGAGVAACPPPETLSGEGDNLSHSVRVGDNLGNETTGKVGFKIDRTAPVTSVTAPEGWQKSEVTLPLKATDNLSGVARTEYSVDGGSWVAGNTVQLGEGRHSVSYRSTDTAGNVENVKSVSVDIDLTGPTIAATQDPAANENGWNSSDVTVTFTCDDSLSGIASCSDPQTVTQEGQKTDVRGEAVDKAGNTNAFVHTVSIDKTKPTIEGHTSGTVGENGWYTSDVTVPFSCADALSGIKACSPEQTLGEGQAQSVTGSATDAAGNTQTATVSGVNVDKTPPSTTSDAPAGWQKDDVTVNFTAIDALSGVARSEYSLDNGQTWLHGSTVTLEEGRHALLFRSVDKAGNPEQAQGPAMVLIDKTAPTITPHLEGRPGDNGWFTGPVTVSFTCADNEGGSGLSEGACPASFTVEEGEHASVPASVTDIAGNRTMIDAGPINVDKTAPVTSVEAPADWTKEEVTLSLTASDNLSGVAKTEYRVDEGEWLNGTSIKVGEGVHNVDYFSTDRAGNVEAVKSVTVKIDLSAPTIQASQDPAANEKGWNNTDVTVTFTCTDDLSGVKDCSGAETVTDEGSTTVNGDATDNAGNRGYFPYTVRIDKTPPTIAPTISGTQGANGWFTSDVGVTFACADPGSASGLGSGIAACEDPTSVGEGKGQVVTGKASDLAGNESSASTPELNVDKMAPVTHSDAPTGWQQHDVTVHFSAEDALSGVDHTEFSLDAGATWKPGDQVTLGEGEHSLLYRSVDVAGNVETAQPALVQVDKTGPALSLGGPSSVSTETATLTGTVGDTTSGLAQLTVAGDIVTPNSDGTFSTSVKLACGSNSIQGVATDVAGNTTTATHDVNLVCAAPVVWSTKGFFAPVEMGKGVVNNAKAGSTVPLKFQVFKDGIEQTDVSAVTGMKVSSVACDTGAVNSTVDQLTTGSTSLRYTGGQFIQNWQTPKVAGCYVASVQLVDGTSLQATFKLK